MGLRRRRRSRGVVVRRALVVLPALLTGCLSLSRHHGAKVLEKGQVEVGVGLGARTPDDPALFPLPIPQGPVLARIGLGGDVDLGFKGYVLGSGFDLRYRFFHDGPWHVAVNPGVGFVVIPNLLNPAQIGSIEARMPLVAEVDASRWLSLSFGTHATLRQNISLGPDSTVARFDLYTGIGGRAEARAGLFAFGFAADGVFAPTRFTNVPSLVIALDARVRTRSKEEAEARRVRRANRKAARAPTAEPRPPGAPAVAVVPRVRWVPARIRWARWSRTDEEARVDEAFGASGRSGWAPPRP